MTDQGSTRITWGNREMGCFLERGYKWGYRMGLHFSEKGVTKVGF